MANGSSQSSEEITGDLHTSVDVEGLAASMREDIKNLPPLFPNCCIYGVPERLRNVNEKAYLPRVVSIGPLHHGKEGLQAMEEHKRRYLRDFLEHSQKPIEEFLKFISEREKSIRECYAETVNLRSDEFVKIILVNAAFIIELFLRRYWSDELISDDDRICRKPRMFRDIRCDLLLLENQIPFFVLEDLLFMANIKNSSICTTLMELTRQFLRNTVGLANVKPEEKIYCSEAKRLINFLRKCLIPREPKNGTALKETESESLRTATALKETESESIRSATAESESIRTATALKEAGVKFKASSSKNLFDIKFNGGVLEVPRIRITDHEERLLRNLLAFEQCHCGSGYMGDYVIFMDNLINTSKDVELLVQSGVIDNWLADSQEVCNLFNKLSDGIVMSDNFHFAQLRKELNDHCSYRCNKWMATLRHEYFKTPWRVSTIIAAAILLRLTFIQTVCSVISVNN